LEIAEGDRLLLVEVDHDLPLRDTGSQRQSFEEHFLAGAHGSLGN
jgi:hypothetical protein